MEASEIKKLATLAAAWSITPQSKADARREGCRRGGTTSKRPQVYPMTLLEPVLGRSTLEQVAALGVSMSTVSKIRAQRRAAGLEN